MHPLALGAFCRSWIWTSTPRCSVVLMHPLALGAFCPGNIQFTEGSATVSLNAPFGARCFLSSRLGAVSYR